MTHQTTLDGFVTLEDKTIKAESVEAVVPDMRPGRKREGHVASSLAEECVIVYLSSGMAFVFFEMSREDIEAALDEALN